MTDCLIEFFKKQDVEYYKPFKISDFSSIGIGGNAMLAVMPDSETKLINIVDFLLDANIDFRVVGRMTNILAEDGFYHGVLVLTSKLNRYSVAENKISAQCGVLFSKLLYETSRFGLSGFEELYGIPGSVGGMVFSNAGAYGKCICDCFLCGEFYSPSKRRLLSLDSSDMCFSYRHSIMKNSDLILLSARLCFEFCDGDSARRKMREILKKRKESQPYGEKSIGSIFKRQGDIPISRLIDELGLKGLSVGGAMVSEKHAGFIVNSGGATADDVKNLIEVIKNKLYSAYGFFAEEEIEYM